MNTLIHRAVALVLVGGVALAWFVTLRPAAIGGPASYIFVSGTSMLPTLETGDLVITMAAGEYAIGDVIAFRIPDGEPGAGALVIHRIVGGAAAGGFVTRGDNLQGVDEWHPTSDTIVGRQWLHLPGVGAAVAWLRQPLVLAPLAAGLTAFFIVMGGDVGLRSRRSAAESVR